MISLPVCRWPHGHYFKKENNLFNEQKMLQTFFLNKRNTKKNKNKYKHFAITFKT